MPLVLFSYLNPILAAGPDALTRAARRASAASSLTDLPVGADPEREAWVGESPLAFIRLVAPTTPRERMSEIAAHGSGFVYLISRLGVTGMRDDIAAGACRQPSQRLRERGDASGLRRLWRVAAGAGRGVRADRRRRRRRQRDRSRRR